MRTHVDIFCLLIYYIRMNILFAVISIAAFLAEAVFAVLAIRSRSKACIGRAVICCCILAASVVGFTLSAPGGDTAKPASVHVTVSPVKGTPAPVQTDAPSAEPSAPAQAQGTYTASSRSDKFHLPFCPSAARISDNNRLWFSSRDEAVAAGYSPCGRCKP